MRSSHPQLRVILRDWFCRTWFWKTGKAAGWAAVMVSILATAGVVSGQVGPGAGNPLSVDTPLQENPADNAAGNPQNNPQSNPRTRTIQQELRLAGEYLVGKGVAKDPAQAAYWFRKAADQGDPGAQNELGYLYIWGIGVDRDETQAFKWFARAAGAGLQQGKLNLAVMYLKGIGMARDTGMARDLLTELAEKGNGRAADYLGILYFEGYNVPQDRSVAEQWFARSAKDKNPEGEYAMGQLYSVASAHEHDFRKAAKFLRDSAGAGYVPALYTLGVLLVNHPEIAQKKTGEAFWMLERAAEAGTWQSSAELGVLARDGRGTRQDVREAYRWFTIAAKQGGPEADESTRANRETCRAALAAGEQDEELRAAESWLADHPHVELFVFNDMHSEFPVGEVYAAKGNAME